MARDWRRFGAVLALARDKVFCANGGRGIWDCYVGFRERVAWVGCGVVSGWSRVGSGNEVRVAKEYIKSEERINVLLTRGGGG